MKKPTRKDVLIYVILSLIVILLGVVIFNETWMQVIWILAVAVVILYFAMRFLNFLHIENLEIIRKTNDYAEKSIKEVLETMPLGVMRYNRETKELLWLNPYADYVFAAQKTEITKDKIEEILRLDHEEKNFMEIGEKQYYFYLHTDEGLIYFIDITSEQVLRHEIQNRQLVIGNISVDNYDDATEMMEEKEKSVLNSMITTIITDWLDGYKVFSKRINREKYFFVTRYGILKKMMDSKFDLVDEFREKMEETNTSLTLSIGVSYGLSSSRNIGNVANNNLEVALVRGGDQVVVKEDTDTSKPQYFGGKSSSVVKRTRVRSRAMATALRGIINEAEEIYIMGHRFPDLDAIGASFGMRFLASKYNPKVKVILDESQFIVDVERCMEEVKQTPELYNSIISPSQAMHTKSENSLLIMVDYNRPSLSISEELYHSFEKIVIIDHHRRSDEYPEKPILSYIESGASSASELITELIQYLPNKIEKISRIEATLLMAGIVVDTKSFQSRTTSRTFETASFLRAVGADNGKVQALLSRDLNSYMDMNEIIANNEKMEHGVVIACGSNEKAFDTVTISKAADTILSLSGVESSFVVCLRTDNKVGISARSKGKINVQTIMEKLGGGGHFNNAAVQIENSTVHEAKEKLVDVLKEVFNEEKEEIK